MIKVVPLGDASVIIVAGGFSIAYFKDLIQRGANLWPNAPMEIKEFADMVTNGKIMQDYSVQDTSQKKK